MPVPAPATIAARGAEQKPEQSAAGVTGIAKIARIPVIAGIAGLTRTTGIKTSVAHSMKSSCVFEAKPHTVLYASPFFFVLSDSALSPPDKTFHRNPVQTLR